MISQLFRREFKTVGAYDGTATAKKMVQESGAVIVMEDDVPLGLLCAEDLVSKTYSLVIDCLSEKPKIELDQSLAEAIDLMKKCRVDALPVYDGGKLIGIIHKNDMLDYFVQSIATQQTAVQQIIHDLKNPISNISGLHELLGQNISKDENKALLACSQKACKHATEILNNILIAERNKGLASKNEIELTGFLNDCFAEIKGNACLRKINLVSQLPQQPYLVLADRRKLARVIHNLLSNALKFTAHGGEIRLSLTIDEAQYTIAIGDTGVGIPLAIQPLIFQKFTLANRLGTSGENSTGLGLSITKELVEQLGGIIEFESEENVGTVFYLRFDI